MKNKPPKTGIDQVVSEQGSIRAALSHLYVERRVAVKSLKEIKFLVFDLLNTFESVENGLTDKQNKIIDDITDRVDSWRDEK